MDFTDDTFNDKGDAFTVNGKADAADDDCVIVKVMQIKKDPAADDASKAATATNEVSIIKKSLPIICKMCDTRILYDKSAESHFDGNKHKRKVNRYQLMKAIAKEFGIAIEESDAKIESEPTFNQISFLEKQVEKFLCCTTCNISVTGFDNMLVHLSSQKHSQVVEKRQMGNRNFGMKPQMRSANPKFDRFNNKPPTSQFNRFNNKPPTSQFNRFNNKPPTSQFNQGNKTPTSQFNRFNKTPTSQFNRFNKTPTSQFNRFNKTPTSQFNQDNKPPTSQFNRPARTSPQNRHYNSHDNNTYNYNGSANRNDAVQSSNNHQFNYNSRPFSNAQQSNPPWQTTEYIMPGPMASGMGQDPNFSFWNPSGPTSVDNTNRNQRGSSYISPLKRDYNQYDDAPPFPPNNRPYY